MEISDSSSAEESGDDETEIDDDNERDLFERTEQVEDDGASDGRSKDCFSSNF